MNPRIALIVLYAAGALFVAAVLHETLAWREQELVLEQARREADQVAADLAALRQLAAESREIVGSWYGDELRGRPTASGEPFNPDDLTFAHRTLPFGTPVRFVASTGKAVVLRANDRGPYVKNKAGKFTRDVDLSRAAADALGVRAQGVFTLTMQPLP